MKNNDFNYSNNRIVTKPHLKFIRFINTFTLLTIAILIYELTSKKDYFYSYISLGIVFILKGISQYFYYKNNKTIRDIIIGIIFFIIGVIMTIYPFR